MELSLKLLDKAAYEERLAHLLLFHGGNARLRREKAMRLALIFNCENSVEGEPCNQCPPCRKILTGNHPDVSILQPLKTTIGIEQILEWQKKVYQKHYEGRYKIFLIEQADSLTLPAANALLKVAEEPPERTIIVFSAENAEGLLPTLRSRSQNVYFSDIFEDSWLEEVELSDKYEALEAYHLSGEKRDLAEQILEMGTSSVKQWIGDFREAVDEKDFSRLFPLFPLDNSNALLYLQVMAVQIEKELKNGNYHAQELIAISKAIEALQQQANARLVMEVLALELFRRGGTIRD